MFPKTLKKNSTKNIYPQVRDDLEINSPRGSKREFGRYSGADHSFEKVMGIGSDPSDSEESDDDDIQGTSTRKSIQFYDPKEFEDLEVSAEIKELFHNIMRSAQKYQF